MTLALIRHGMAAANTRGAYLGSTDEPLCDEAIEALRSIRAPAVKIVLTSPLLRCVQTAQLLYPSHTPVIVPDLRERHFGSFEGKTHAEIIALPGYKDWGMTAQSMDFPGGETMDAFLYRAKKGFAQAMEQISISGGHSAAIVCHGGVIMAILSQLADPPRDYYGWQCANGCGYLLAYDGTKLTLTGDLK